MTAKTIECDLRRLADFIAGTLGDFECRTFETHLDECSRGR